MEKSAEAALLSRLDARALVSRFGSPLWVIDETVLLERCRRLRELEDATGIRPFYAVKANDSPAILAAVRAAGFGADAVSPGELRLALAAGFPPEAVTFTGNMLREDELAFAFERGAGVILDSLPQIALAGRVRPGASVGIRANLGGGAGHHAHVVTAGPDSKFGIDAEDLGDARHLAAESGLVIRGLHQHVGSGILDPALFVDRMRALAAAAEPFRSIEFLDFGGGIGIPYRPDQNPFDLDRFAKAAAPVLDRFRRDRGGRPIEFRLQPGRYVAAECGVLLLRVTALVRGRRHTFLGVDGGMNHLIRPALYGAHHEVRNLSRPDAPKERFTVVGPICESADVLAKDRLLPRPEIGDVLGVLDAGAYGRTMSSFYNRRAIAPEVMLRRDGSATPVRPAVEPPDA